MGGGVRGGGCGGGSNIMQRLAPLGDTYQAGTLSGNPVAMASGITTLDILIKESGWERLEQIGAQVERSPLPVLAEAPFPVHLVRAGSLFWMSFHEAGAPRPAAPLIEAGSPRFTPVFPPPPSRPTFPPPSAFQARLLSPGSTTRDRATRTAAW